MKAKLIKVDNGWVLMVDNVMYATDNDKLSLKNCQAIERGYDLDELAREEAEKLYNKSEHEDYNIWEYLVSDEVESIKIGFQKALELLGDKKYTLGKLIKAIDMGRVIVDGKYAHSSEEIYQSLQQTEWDVTFNPDEKDSDGCLILKRINL